MPPRRRMQEMPPVRQGISRTHRDERNKLRQDIGSPDERREGPNPTTSCMRSGLHKQLMRPLWWFFPPNLYANAHIFYLLNSASVFLHRKDAHCCIGTFPHILHARLCPRRNKRSDRRASESLFAAKEEQRLHRWESLPSRSAGNPSEISHMCPSSSDAE